jgi:hypothetical protein
METPARLTGPTSGSLRRVLIVILAAWTIVLQGCGQRQRPIRVSIPAAPPAPLALTCSIQPSEVTAGEPITAAAIAGNFIPGDPLAYDWSASGAKVTANGNSATIDTTTAAPGSYSVTAHVRDPKVSVSGEATCSAAFTVKALAPKNPPTVSCTANPNFIKPGERSTLTCLCTSPDGAPTSIAQWSTSSGRIIGSGNTVLLDPEDSREFRMGVNALCTDARGLTSSGLVAVLFNSPGATVEEPAPDMAAPPPPPPPPQILATGREFLLSGDKEKPGYGLYSYLLWYNPPAPQDRDRFLTIITAFMELSTVSLQEGDVLVPDSEGHLAKPAETIPKPNLNIAYLPLNAIPPQSPTADWILDHYDTSRARILVDRVNRGYKSGPYIVSTLAPLNSTLARDSHFLFQDLSARVVPPEVAAQWIAQFQNQASSPDFSKPDQVTKFVLHLRTTVADLAIRIPEAQKGVAAWIQWISPKK